MNDIDVLDDPALTGLVAELRAVGAGTPPPVGDELEALFTGNAIPISSRRGRRVAVIALVGAAALGGTLGTAAADSLPNPAQRFVSDVIGILTPFDLPTPADKVKPAPKAPAHLTPTTPAPQPTSHAGESGDDSGGSKGSDDRSDDSGSTSDDHSGSSGSSGSDDSSSTSGSGTSGTSGTSGSSGSDDTSGTSGSGTSGSGSDDSTSGHSGSDDKTSDSSSSGGSTDD